MSKDVILLGAGGHARVLVDAIHSLGELNIIGAVDAHPERVDSERLGTTLLGMDDELMKYPVYSIELVNAVASVKDMEKHRIIYELFKRKGYHFASIRHASALVARNVILSEGTQILIGSVINVNVSIGENAIINTSSSIDHDCVIGSHVHIAPGVVLSGGVIIEDETHVGAGATIIQGVKIGKGVTIGAGAVVLRDVENDAVVAGVPAHSIGRGAE